MRYFQLLLSPALSMFLMIHSLALPTNNHKFFSSEYKVNIKQIDKQGRLFEIKPGEYIRTYKKGGKLNQISVFITRTFVDPELGKVFNTISDNLEKFETKEQEIKYDEKQRYCCISKSEKDQIIKLVDNIKPIGEFIEKDVTLIIGPAGWSRYNEYYSLSRISYFRRNCTENNDECGFSTINVLYKK